MEKIQPKNWREKNCQNPFQTIQRLKKKRKKVAWTTKPVGGEGGFGRADLIGPTTEKTSVSFLRKY